MIQIHPLINERLFKDEPTFSLFNHGGLLCCVQRNPHFGNFNGYVGISKTHALYGKEYSDKIVVKDVKEVEFNGNYIGMLCASPTELEANIISLDIAINVHGGLTYSRNHCPFIENDIFPDTWWFGFDTLHSGDLNVYQTDIDRQFPIRDDEYRTFEYVKEQTIKLAEQLNQL